MAVQVEWNLLEASLLLEAYLEIQNNTISKMAAIHRLSEDLRKMAVNQGLEIDDVFRNENGITFQLYSMDSAYKGHTVVKPASRLFKEIVSIYRDNNSEYLRILHMAMDVVNPPMSNMDRFKVWLLNNTTTVSCEFVMNNLKAAEEYCTKKLILKTPLLETTDVAIIRKVFTAVESDKLFRVTYKNRKNDIHKAVSLYYKYVKSIFALQNEDKPLVSSERTGEKSAQEEAANDSSPFSAQTPMPSCAKEEITEQPGFLLDCLAPLMQEYPDVMVTNMASNGEFQMHRVYIYLKSMPRQGNVLIEVKHLPQERYYKLYLKRVLMTEEEYEESCAQWNKTTQQRGRIKRQWASVSELLDYLRLKLRIVTAHGFSLYQNNGQASNYEVASSNDDTSEDPALKYLKSKGIEYYDLRDKQGCLWIVGGLNIDHLLNPLRAAGMILVYKHDGGIVTGGREAYWTKESSDGFVLDDQNASALDSVESKPENIVDSRMLKKHPNEYRIIQRKLFELSNQSESGVTVSELLDALNIGMDYFISDDILANAPWAEICGSIYGMPKYRYIGERPDEINDEPTVFVEEKVDIEDSLRKTIEYLETRYSVRQHYDRFTNPTRYSNDMLYKARNHKKDIMWVYYIHSKSSHYVSIETEPEYIESINDAITGFTKIINRQSHPCRKMIFEDYNAVKDSLALICDSIDKYFSASRPVVSPIHQDPPFRGSNKRIVDWNSSISLEYTKPTGYKLFDMYYNASSWAELYLGIIAKLQRVYSEILKPNMCLAEKDNGNIELGDKEASATMRKARGIPGTGLFVEVNLSAKDIVNRIKHILDLCRIDRSCAEIFYSEAGSSKEDLKNKLLSISRVYDEPQGISVSRIKSMLGNGFNEVEIIDLLDNVSWATKVADGVYSFSKHPVRPPVTEPIVPQDYDKDRFIETLMQRYRNGMTFDSIDYDNFREEYELLFDESLNFDDAELEKRLRYCGVVYKGRVFPAEGIMDNETKEHLFNYIDNCFASGKKVLYYKAIFADLADDFRKCFSLADENMLRAFIEFTADKDKYFFFTAYMAKERYVQINHNVEIEQYMLSAGKPVAVNDVCAALSHIPEEQVRKIINFDSRFLRDSKGVYFHTGIFEVTDDELEQISGIIRTHINENEYAIWASVWNEIKERMPVFIENNLYLSSLGIRNALGQRFSGRLSFSGEVISLPQNHFEMGDIYHLFAKHHTTFSIDDLNALSKELGTAIYFDAVANASVRISYKQFVSRDMINFDIKLVDDAIKGFISKDYLRIREIESFLAFPNVGFEWNSYLLESYLLSYSADYVLLSTGRQQYNVTGAIVPKGGRINEFCDACAEVLADGPISLKKEEALKYLVETNMISMLRYKGIDEALNKAAQIRGRRS